MKKLLTMLGVMVVVPNGTATAQSDTARFAISPMRAGSAFTIGSGRFQRSSLHEHQEKPMAVRPNTIEKGNAVGTVWEQLPQDRWGLRLILFEPSRDSYQTSNSWLGTHRMPNVLYSGLGFDYDLDRQWSLGFDALASWGALSGGDGGLKVHVYDPAVERYDRNNGDYLGKGVTSIYQQRRSAMGFTLHANRRFVPMRRSSPYAGVFAGLRREQMMLYAPVNQVDHNVELRNGPKEGLTSIVYTVPVGVRLGLDFRAGPMYYDLYLHAAYQFGGGDRYFDAPLDAKLITSTGLFGTGKRESFRKNDYTYGFGFAVGFGRRLRKEGERKKPELPVQSTTERGWGVRLVLMERAFDNSRRGGPSTGIIFGGLFRPSTFTGIGFDVDLDKRWSMGMEVSMDPVLAFGEKRYGGSYHDPTVTVLLNGSAHAQGASIYYEQSGGAYAVNTRAAYRFSDRRRSSPYVGGWAGLRIDHVIMSDPKILINNRPAGAEYGLSSDPPTSMSTTRITVPVGLRLGMDLRAGRTYYDLYMYGGYKIGAERNYFDLDMRGTVLEGGEVQVSGVMRDHPISVGFGVAMGIGRRTHTTRELGGN
ncbi:MAG: hypothetical protein IPJ76_10535 [Flavobacteriales bacterium]|nr:MAG: hypothetical protein IPJ76_10535 [Flavobacteriales bacterium]